MSAPVLQTDLAVIGAGPAGLSAALAAARAGARVLLLDEYSQPGGQYMKQLAQGFSVPDTSRLDDEMQRGAALAQAVRDAGVVIEPSTLVLASFAPGELAISRRGEPALVRARAIVVATGAHERAIAFPGWDLPGVMTPGGAQTLAKTQRVLPGRRIVLAGSGPFLMPVAKSLLAIGAEIVAVFETTRPRAWSPHVLRLAGHGERVREALAYRRMLRAARVPVHFNHIVVEAVGTDAVERVRVVPCDDAGRVRIGAGYREIEADALCVGYGFVPAVQLTRALGCAHRHAPVRGGWVPEHDQDMRTTVANVFVAGEVAGIGGAPVAAAEGQLAGLAAARTLGCTVDDRALAQARRERAHRRRFADLVGELFPVKPAYYAPITDATIVCRCEEVTAGEVRRAAAEWGGELNFIKGVTRCGMGYCQGRICGSIVEALVCQTLGIHPGSAGALTVRTPLKPVPVEVLAGLAND